MQKKAISLLGEDLFYYYENNHKSFDLLFIHGFGGSSLRAPIWNEASLRAKYNVYSLDLPLKVSDNGTNNIFYFADLVIALILKLELKNLTLMGHSMGGGIAALVNQKMASALHKTVLIAPMNQTSLVKKQVFEDYFFPQDFATYKKLIDLVSYQGAFFYNSETKAQKLYQEFLTMQKNFFQKPAYKQLGKSLPDPKNMEAIAQGIKKAQALVLIYGQADGIIDTAKIAPYIAKLNPLVTVYEISKSGHSPWKENLMAWRAVLKKLSAF